MNTGSVPERFVVHSFHQRIYFVVWSLRFPNFGTQSRYKVNCRCNARFVHTVNDLLWYEDNLPNRMHHPTLILSSTIIHALNTAQSHCIPVLTIGRPLGTNPWSDGGKKKLHEGNHITGIQSAPWYTKIANKSRHRWSKIRGETNYFLYYNFNKCTQINSLYCGHHHKPISCTITIIVLNIMHVVFTETFNKA